MTYEHPTPAEAALYAYLADLARRGKPCPTNQEIGKHFGIAERSVAARLYGLRQKRKVRVVTKKGYYRVVTLIVLGISTKKQEAPAQNAPYDGKPIPGAMEFMAETRIASEKLLRRHLTTGKHWITDPAQFQAACASVGL